MTALALLLAACSDRAPTSPSPEDPPEEVPTTTESWQGVVPVGGTAHYSFGVGQRGEVKVTLQSVSGQQVPPTVMLELAVGTPDGTGCSATTTTTAQAGVEPQLTGTYDPGVYCARVSDIGNLFAPATVLVSIEHP